MNAGHPGHGRRVMLIFGIKAYLLIQLIILMVAGGAGVWMFYVQHQFEDVLLRSAAKTGATFSAALEGSSFYKLPRILQWFSGNIGFHHIHHLSPRIPKLQSGENASGRPAVPAGETHHFCFPVSNPPLIGCGTKKNKKAGRLPPSPRNFAKQAKHAPRP